MTKTKTTVLEMMVLDNIALNSYQPTNYGKPETFDDTSDIWSWGNLILDSSAAEKPALKSLPGIVSSLSKKGLVSIGRGTGKDATIRLTETGFAIWHSWANPVDTGSNTVASHTDRF